MRAIRPVFLSFLLTVFATPLHAQQFALPGTESPRGSPASLSERQTQLLWKAARDGKESSKDGPPVWLGGGVGVGTYGLSALADFSLRGEDASIFMARWARTAGWHPDASDLSVLYGLSEDGAAILAGLGVAWGNRLVESPDGVATGPAIGPTLGAALQAQLPLVTSDSFQLALTGFANVNPEKPFGGAALTLKRRPF